MFNGLILEPLGILKEPHARIDNLPLINRPLLLQMIDNLSLRIQQRQDLLPSNIRQPQNPITHLRRLDNLHPANLTRIIAMRPTARLHIRILDIHHTKVIARHDTTLIQAETELFLGLGLIHEVFVDWVAFEDDFVGLVLDGHLLLVGEGGEMGDVEVGA